MSFTPPVDHLNRGHATLWGNLGDWSEAHTYTEAAEALARRLGEAAGLACGQRVVDLGCGAGDQLRLWVEEFGVEQVTGVDRDRGFAERAAERTRDWGLDARMTVMTGDALAAPWDSGVIDAVVALDASYFFGSRDALLRRCHSALRPAGVVAFTDLILGEGALARISGGLAPLFGVPGGDLLTEPDFRQSFADNGFRELDIVDCTDEVLGGFSRWIRAGGDRDAVPHGIAARLGLAITGRAAGLLAGPSGLRYVIATARRGSA